MKVRRPGTTVEELYQTIRDHIINGQYHPGYRLSQQTLATELKVSRTPLREALSRLAAEGLVVGEANRGMEVAPVYNDHAEQSYGLRLLIEPPTIGAIVDDISKQDVDQMQSVLEQMERSANSHRIQEFQQAHLQFHEATLRYYPDTFRELIQSLTRRSTGISGYTSRVLKFPSHSFKPIRPFARRCARATRPLPGKSWNFT